jgi:hypothetical protein
MSSLARYAWFVLVFNVIVILLGAVVRATAIEFTPRLQRARRA